MSDRNHDGNVEQAAEAGEGIQASDTVHQNVLEPPFDADFDIDETVIVSFVSDSQDGVVRDPFDPTIALTSSSLPPAPAVPGRAGVHEDGFIGDQQPNGQNPAARDHTTSPDIDAASFVEEDGPAGSADTKPPASTRDNTTSPDINAASFVEEYGPEGSTDTYAALPETESNFEGHTQGNSVDGGLLVNQGLAIDDGPRSQDILFGRGNKVNQHEGNKLFRGVVKDYFEEYFVEGDGWRKEKRKIVTKVYEEVTAKGCKFLNLVAGTSEWEELELGNSTEGLVHRKIAQAFRTLKTNEKNNEIRRTAPANSRSNESAPPGSKRKKSTPGAKKKDEDDDGQTAGMPGTTSAHSRSNETQQSGSKRKKSTPSAKKKSRMKSKSNQES